jgi:O-acetylserine/cysteine efflux transporter
VALTATLVMTPRDMGLAALTSAIWGLAFVATRLGLDGFSPPELTLLRFVIAALPAFFVPRPAIPLTMLVLIGATLFAGQFLLLFFAFEAGMSPGVASVTQQMHAFLTVALSAAFLGERPSRDQLLGLAVAMAGLALIALTIGGNLTLAGLSLALGAAFSWAVGNTLVKRLGPVPMLPLMVWASLVPPLPALAIAAIVEPSASIVDAVAEASWISLASAIYLGAVATVAGYAIWGRLLARYPSALVAPFALLAPCVGVITSAIVFDERFTPMRLAGMVLILAGLCIVVLRRRPA